MAKKSKTQRAKASAARAARKAQQREQADQSTSEANAPVEAAASEKTKRTLFKKADADAQPKPEKKPETKIEKKAEKKPEKKKRFQFLRDVRGEMKRVTWPTRQDVLRWSVVVVAALVFFGVYVALLDNVIITPVLVGLSGLGM